MNEPRLQPKDDSAEATAAFTLIEMSIVLVIVGLLVGGIFAGSEMIRSSYVRSMMTEKEQLATAMNTFKVKYGCLSGDCAKASNFFSAAINGNGNSVLDAPGAIYEQFSNFDHLTRAGFISNVSAPASSAATGLPFATTGIGSSTPVAVPGVDIPKSRYPKVGYLAMPGPANSWVCPTDTLTGGWYPPGACNLPLIIFSTGESDGNDSWYFAGARPQPAIPCNDIISLDLKFDDGKPFAGKVQIGTSSTGYSCYSLAGGDTPGNYVNAIYAPSTTAKSVIIFTNAY